MKKEFILWEIEDPDPFQAPSIIKNQNNDFIKDIEEIKQTMKGLDATLLSLFNLLMKKGEDKYDENGNG